MKEFEVIKNALTRIGAKFDDAEWVIGGVEEQLINITNADGTFVELWFVDGEMTVRNHIT